MIPNFPNRSPLNFSASTVKYNKRQDKTSLVSQTLGHWTATLLTPYYTWDIFHYFFTPRNSGNVTKQIWFLQIHTFKIPQVDHWPLLQWHSCQHLQPAILIKTKALPGHLVSHQFFSNQGQQCEMKGYMEWTQRSMVIMILRFARILSLNVQYHLHCHLDGDFAILTLCPGVFHLSCDAFKGRVCIIHLARKRHARPSSTRDAVGMTWP